MKTMLSSMCQNSVKVWSKKKNLRKFLGRKKIVKKIEVRKIGSQKKICVKKILGKK